MEPINYAKGLKVCQMNLRSRNMTKKCGCPQKIMERLNAVTQ